MLSGECAGGGVLMQCGEIGGGGKIEKDFIWWVGYSCCLGGKIDLVVTGNLRNIAL